ncbi:MAG: hypothetical protein RLY30_47 [Pseudomonadota bacterium]
MTHLQADTLPQRKGRAFHALMEAWSLLDLDRDLRPEELVQQPVWARLLSPYALSGSHLLEVIGASQGLLAAPPLRAWIGLPGGPQPAQRWSERTWRHPDGRSLRPDWVLRYTTPQEQVRIVDWKWAVLPSEHAAYADQLVGYRELMQHHFPSATVEASLVSAQGEIWRLEGEGLVHCNPAGRPAL